MKSIRFNGLPVVSYGNACPMPREAVFYHAWAVDYRVQQPRVGGFLSAASIVILQHMKVLLRWFLLAAALLLVAHLYPGVQVASFGAAMIGALVLGLLNTLVRPLLVLLTLPVTLLTLGLFLFVINALMFWMAGSVLSGFQVASFGAALVGSLIYSLCGMFIDVVVERLFSPAIR